MSCIVCARISGIKMSKVRPLGSWANRLVMSETSILIGAEIRDKNKALGRMQRRA